jgi:FMN reductase
MSGVARVVGIGGAIRHGSTSETALRWVMAAIAARGIDTTTFLGADLNVALFDPAAGAASDDPRILRYVDAVRACDAVVIASPVYHGNPSGLVKNALDHLQPLAGDARPYLSGRPVLCLAAGGGVQGAVGTLSALRDTVHALRGWPTPMQVPVNASARPFDDEGRCVDPRLEKAMTAAIDDLTRFVAAFAGPGDAVSMPLRATTSRG